MFNKPQIQYYPFLKSVQYPYPLPPPPTAKSYTPKTFKKSSKNSQEIIEPSQSNLIEAGRSRCQSHA